MPVTNTENSKMVEYIFDRLIDELKRVCLLYVRGPVYPLGCQIIIHVRGKVGVDVDPRSIPWSEYRGDGPSRFKFIEFGQEPYDDVGDRGCDCPVVDDEYTQHLDIEHTDDCELDTADEWAYELVDLYGQRFGGIEAELSRWLDTDCEAESLADLIAANEEEA